MASHDVQSVLQTVKLIGDAEKTQDAGSMGQLLHPELVFRRADGSVAGKSDVLKAMSERQYKLRDAEIVAVEAHPAARTAVVTVIVRAKGIVLTTGEEFGGTFRNVMTLERDNDSGRWKCRLWVNTRWGITVETLHHVSLPVSNLEQSRRFYRDVVGLRERDRPAFDFDGAWFQFGAGQLHLIVHKDRPSPPTFRAGKPVDSRDIHFALRVRSFRETLGYLQSLGYSEKAENELLRLRVSEQATAGFPQIYILDPDHHVIELNAERLDDDPPSVGP
ncbi:DUF4440 domain-containing protein [Sinorhizobium chiapasense]|uniref:DUF4440 domain-containing protein n=1 Tax=Sinorhizobium chiapasense TaxID=501572 RepID=A0ABZ2BLH6_9HYPH